MKLWTDKIKNVLRSKKGETMMEAIVSIIILAILLTTITAMISTSRLITARSMQRAGEVQEDIFNKIAQGNDLDSLEVSTSRFDDDGVVVFTLPSKIGTEEIRHNIRFFEDAGDNTNIPVNLVAFFPNP